MPFDYIVAFFNKYSLCDLLKIWKFLKKENFCEVFAEFCHLYIEANFYI